MSTKTTFKRIALVAVAALGLGVLSVAPSQADVSGLTVTVTDGTATTFNSDSTTAAKIKVQWLALAGAADSVTVSVAAASALPTGAAVPTPQFMFLESTTSVALSAGAVRVDTTSVNIAFDGTKQAVPGAAYAASLGAHLHPGSTANGTYSATMRFWLNETTTASTTIVAGTYNYNAIVTTYSTAPGSTAPITQVVPFKITVSAAAAEDTLVNASKSFAKLTTSSTTLANSVASGTDAVVTGVATAGQVAGYLYVGVRNADGTKYNVAEDSLTVTLTGPGLVCDGSTCGKSLIKIKSTGDRQFSLVGDGSAGTASVVVTSTANTYAAKSVNFYAKSATTITTSIRHPLLRVGTNSDAIQVTAVDAAGATWTGKAYIVASSAADALIAGSTTPVACTDYSAANGTRCSITAIAPGTAKFKVIDADTVAGATATSAEFTVTVSAASVATVAIAFDKTTYQPFEKAIITVTPLDSAGKSLQTTSSSALLASGGITSTQAFTGSSDTLTSTSITTSASTSSSSNTVAGAKTYVVYMPAQGDVTISATGGTDLPLAGQVKISATATVVNNAVDAATDAANEATDAANAATDAALAAADAADAATAAAQEASDAVAALSATVAKLVASLKAQITSLTNLVIKIQKKVKA